MSFTHGHADRDEEQQAQQGATNDLYAARDQDHGTGTDDLLEIDLESDHEQHEDQAVLGNDRDRVLGLDPAGSKWTNDEPRDQISENRWLPRKLRSQPQHPRKQDAERDVPNQFVHESSLTAAIQSRTRLKNC